MADRSVSSVNRRAISLMALKPPSARRPRERLLSPVGSECRWAHPQSVDLTLAAFAWIPCGDWLSPAEPVPAEKFQLFPRLLRIVVECDRPDERLAEPRERVGRPNPVRRD